jgi:hypothetical protein
MGVTFPGGSTTPDRYHEDHNAAGGRNQCFEILGALRAFEVLRIDNLEDSKGPKVLQESSRKNKILRVSYAKTSEYYS